MTEIFGVGITLDDRMALVLAAVFAGGFVRGYTGFGSALIIVPGLAYLVGPREAVLMHAIIEIPVILGLIPAAIKSADRSVSVPMIAMLALTTPIGALILSSIDTGSLKIAISAAVLVMVAMLTVQKQVTALLGRGSTLAGGAIGGLIHGATAIGGPPIVTALVARGDSPDATRGNIIAVMSSVIFVSTVWFAVFGLFTREVLVIGAVVSPVCLLATMAGSYAFRLGGGRGHRTVSLIFLALTAFLTIAVTLAGEA